MSRSWSALGLNPRQETHASRQGIGVVMYDFPRNGVLDSNQIAIIELPDDPDDEDWAMSLMLQREH